MPNKIIFLLLVAVSTLAKAQSSFKTMQDTLAFKIKVEKMSRETNSITSDFTQIKDLSILSEKITSKGKFVFLKRNNLRWEYSIPYIYTIVINNEKIFIKDEGNKVKKYDLESNKVFREINDVMISCVNGDILHSNKFKIKYFENDILYKLELTPLSITMTASLQKINMYFDKTVSSVTKLEMLEPGNDATTIEFYNKKINAQVPPQTFILK